MGAMTNAWLLLLASRKFWMAVTSMIAMTGVVVLRALDKIPTDAMVPMLGAITATGLGVITSIAWEDAAGKKSQVDVQVAPSVPVPASASTPEKSEESDEGDENDEE